MLDQLIASDGVTERMHLAGRVGVMALHGGLEAGTAEAAAEISRRSNASLYSVEQPDDLRWHVPSTRYDPRLSSRLRRFLDHVGLAISLHGFGRRGFEGAVLVGGGNRSFAGRVAGRLRHVPELTVIDDLDRFPKGLRGTHPKNPVNLPAFGGVQIELSPQARSPRPLGEIVDALASVAAAEHRSLCVASPSSGRLPRT